MPKRGRGFKKKKAETESESEEEQKAVGSDAEDNDASDAEGKPAGDSQEKGTTGSAPKPEEAKPAPEPLSFEFRPHTDYPLINAAEPMVYCSVCGLPPDFCQYGPSWGKCKPVCMEKFPQYYPELSGVSLEDAKKSAEAAGAKSKEKLLPGGKKKRELSPHVTIKKLTRGGRKCVTTVTGLDGFDVNLQEVAKLFKKKFACGASVEKGEAGQPDSVDIQGDVEYDIVELLEKEYSNIPADKITVAEGGTKKKGKPR